MITLIEFPRVSLEFDSIKCIFDLSPAKKLSVSRGCIIQNRIRSTQLIIHVLLARPSKLEDHKSENIFNSLGCLKIRVRDLAGLCRVKYSEFIGAHRQ